MVFHPEKIPFIDRRVQRHGGHGDAGDRLLGDKARMEQWLEEMGIIYGWLI